MRFSGENECNVILDCKNLKRIDVTIAKVCNKLIVDVKDDSISI